MSAPFVDQAPVKARLQGVTYRGVTLSSRADSLTYHLIQRVLEGRWADGTTQSEYLSDLRRSAGDPTARVLLYERGEPYVGILGVSRVPEVRWGPRAQPLVYVVYSTARARLVSGYMVASEREVSRPEGAVWLI